MKQLMKKLGWVRESALKIAETSWDWWREAALEIQAERDELRAENHGLREALGEGVELLTFARGALIEAGEEVDRLGEELARAEYKLSDTAEALDWFAEHARDLKGQLESQVNATHARGRSIDWLSGEVDAAQEDARAAKALAGFWMLSWLNALSGDVPKEISA